MPSPTLHWTLSLQAGEANQTMGPACAPCPQAWNCDVVDRVVK